MISFSFGFFTIRPSFPPYPAACFSSSSSRYVSTPD